MLRVGLSGGIGSGKSTVARRFEELGAILIDADAVAREVLATGTTGLAKVTERFGAQVLAPDGSLDRSALGARVFGDADSRESLEAITHPLIAARTIELVSRAEPGRVVVHDVPLLVEKHMGAHYHLVVIVDTPTTTRLARLVESRGMSEADARARMAHQASDDQRRSAADVLLDNGTTREALLEQVDRLWRERLVPYADNLVHGRRHRRGEIPVLVPYDEAWPTTAERITERICRVLGERAPEVEHVGSTSVPGLPARDLIDLQLGVADLRAADEPDFVAALTELGFPRSEGNAMDYPKDLLPDPSLWIKRFHGSSDPARVVHLHIREIGSAGWQYALLYRDWLRADSAARDDYLAEKERLAREAVSAEAYRELKEPWFNAIWPRMQAWAQKTGWQD
ncbi:MAG TPA: dephospho-CoA kinase [Dermatophilaceae bacterium]|nr:dephospho-CoA kinase [Dermatophilaceae bacterium]